MESFLERFIDELNENIGDPNTSTRITTTQKLRLLRTVEKQIWERLMTVAGVASSLGYVETEYDLLEDVDYYNLPGNFRQFHSFTQRVDDDPNYISDAYRLIGPGDTNRGLEIVSGRHGFILHPAPLTDSEDPFVLKYTKGPVLLHRSSGVCTSNSVTATPPDSVEKGEVCTRTDYYKGAILNIYSGEGAPQAREIEHSSGSSNQLTFVLRHELDPVPGGTVLYEISPALPEDYDSLYAIDAAIRVLTRRGQIAKRRELINERSELWNACMNYYLSHGTPTGTQRQLHDTTMTDQDFGLDYMDTSF